MLISFTHVCKRSRVVFGGLKMKAYTPHHSVCWLTFVSAQTQF